jgi:hypothetical protein
MAEDQWNETTHEWEKRLTLLVQQKRLATAQAHDLTVAIDRLVEDHVIDILPRNLSVRTRGTDRTTKNPPRYCDDQFSSAHPSIDTRSVHDRHTQLKSHLH